MFFFKNKTGWLGPLGRKRLAGLVLLLLSGFSAAGQQAWSLADCLDYSRKNNLVIRQQEYERAKYQLRVQATKKRFLPVIDSRWKSASNWGFLIDPSTNLLEREFNLGNQLSLNASMDLFNGSASGHQGRVYNQELRAAEYQYESAINDAALEVTYLYLQALLSTEQLQLAEQRVLELKIQHKKITRQVARGALSKRDVLNIQSLLATEEFNVVLAANSLEKARFTLMQTIGLRQDSLIRIAPVMVSDSVLTAAFTAVKLPAVPEAQFPEVKAGQALVEAAQANVLLLRNSKLPVVSLSSQFGSRTSSSQEAEFNAQLKKNFNQQLGLNLTIPILNNRVVQTNIDIAQLELESARVAQQQVQEEVRQRILSATLEYKAAHRKFISARLSFEALKEEFRFADRQLALGLSNAMAFAEVRSRFSVAQSELLQHKYDCLFKLKILRYYQGEPLH
jgi:outer membrane protein